MGSIATPLGRGAGSRPIGSWGGCPLNRARPRHQFSIAGRQNAVQKEPLLQKQASNDTATYKWSKTEQKRMGRQFIVVKGENNHAGTIWNPKVTKLENETTSDAAETTRIERVAEKAAEKASHTEKQYDQDHQVISK